MAWVSAIQSSKLLGNMPTEKLSISTMSASEKRELRKKLEIQLSKVRSTMQLIEEAESKERISSQTTCSFSVEGAKLGNNSGHNHLSSSLKCESSATTTGSVVSRAGKRRRSLGLFDDQEVVKKQRINKSSMTEKYVVKHSDKMFKSEVGATTNTSCKGKRVYMNKRRYHDAHLGGLRTHDYSRANHVEVQQMSNSNNDSSDGAVSSIDDAIVRHSPRPATSAASCSACREGWEATDYDGHMSPKKDLRAAMLRNRFADTILRAKEKMKEILETKQHEEAKVRVAAAEAVIWKSLKTNPKMEREREREAARLALQKMEKTVEIYESQEIIKEIELLAYRGCLMVNPLQMLGLFLKANEDAEEEEEEEDVIKELNRKDVEEGEIVC